MAKVRFEARLSPEDAGRVHADMQRVAARSQASYVRDCLLAGRAGRADLLSERLGELGILINAVICALDDAADGRAVNSSIKRLISMASATLRKINRHLEEWEG